MKALILSCKQLSKKYPRQSHFLFQDLDLSVGPGKALFLHGANAAGKTTLLKILAGLVSPSYGEISFLGQNFNPHAHALRSKIGFCAADERAFFLNATVLANLRFFYQLEDQNEESFMDRAFPLLKDFDMERYQRTQVKYLSTGFRRRLALLRSMLHRPKLLLLDETFVHFDQDFMPKAVRQVRRYLEEEGAAGVWTSHLPLPTESFDFEIHLA